MRRIIIIITTGLVLHSNITNAQSTLTLDECHRKAIENYPLIRQYDLIAQSEKYSLNNASKSYLPQFALNGQGTYQSDVTKLPIDFASLGLPIDIPEMSKDQYKATIDASQVIWDGGSVNSQQKIIKASTEVEKKKVEVNLYNIKDKVNQLFFGILAIDEILKVYDLKEADINANRETVGAMIKNGIAIQSDLDQIEVELLNLNQQRTEQTSIRQAYLRMLGLFVHENIPANTELQKPATGHALSENITRPELSLYESQNTLYNAQKSSVIAKNMPRISLFAQGGYGRPALNMLEDRFKFFAIGGIKLNWNFGNLYTKKNENRLIETNRSNVEVQRETFLFNTSMQLTQEQAEIEKYRKLLAKDDEIIELRNRIKKAGESKFKNGVYQTNELIRDINAENQARQAKALHEIQYLLSIYNYRHTLGN